MSEYKVAKIEVDTAELDNMLIGAQLICEGLSSNMDWDLEGILRLHKELTREENAYEYLSENYAAFKGAFRTVGAILEMLITALNNEDIIIMPGDRLQMKPYTDARSGK